MTTLPTCEEISHWIEHLHQHTKFDTDVLLKSVNTKERATSSASEEVFGEIKATQLNENYQDCCQSEASSLFVKQVKSLGDFVANNVGNHPDLLLGKELFLKSLSVMDIVTVKSTRSSCFTKKYMSKLA